MARNQPGSNTGSLIDRYGLVVLVLILTASHCRPFVAVSIPSKIDIARLAAIFFRIGNHPVQDTLIMPTFDIGVSIKNLPSRSFEMNGSRSDFTWLIPSCRLEVTPKITLPLWLAAADLNARSRLCKSFPILALPLGYHPKTEENSGKHEMKYVIAGVQQHGASMPCSLHRGVPHRQASDPQRQIEEP